MLQLDPRIIKDPQLRCQDPCVAVKVENLFEKQSKLPWEPAAWGGELNWKDSRSPATHNKTLYSSQGPYEWPPRNVPSGLFGMQNRAFRPYFMTNNRNAMNGHQERPQVPQSRLVPFSHRWNRWDTVYPVWHADPI
jgi:hypothetical protein